EDERALVRELYLRMQMGIYRPTVIVDYDREALTYAPGNVRVTFDRRIRGCHQPQLFFSENLPSIPAISPDRVVMEVKYDDYLPDIVNRTLLTVKTKEQAFSKYAACRIMC
ncbi:MAG TPA: VTC domain-containing protein, partial [Anaerotignum lactatifermentans]|nr:VTC domain-containing protein [Anaerotignum lactatifermentans]